jgi:hypothetical protein
MYGKKFVRGSFAVLVALGLAATPAIADEIEAEEVIVGEEVIAEAEPCPECAINNGSVSFAIGNDLTNAYFFRGILQAKTGLIWQPWGEVTWNVWESAEGDQGAVSSVSLTAGTWNSVQTNRANANTPQGLGAGNWYESDLYAGVGVNTSIGLGAGLTYIAYMSPNSAFGSVQEIDIDLSYDDAGLYGAEMDDLGFSMSPYVLFGFEVDKTRFGDDKGIYMEIGAEPAVTVMQNSDYPVTVGMPLTMGLSLDNYYKPDNNANGSNPGDDVFGYASVGLGVGVPLAFIPARLGAFSVGVSGQWLALGSNLQRFNNGPVHNGGTKTNPEEGRFGEWIGVASLNWAY